MPEKVATAGGAAFSQSAVIELNEITEADAGPAVRSAMTMPAAVVLAEVTINGCMDLYSRYKCIFQPNQFYAKPNLPMGYTAPRGRAFLRL